MNTNYNFEVGMNVIRSEGDYVVGRTGNITEINTETQRARVQWDGNTKTWVSFKALAPTSVPYEIIRVSGKWPKYRKL